MVHDLPEQIEKQLIAHVWPIHDASRAKYFAARPLVWALIKEMARVSREAGAVFLVSLSPTYMDAATDNPPWRNGSFLQEFQDDGAAAGLPALNCVPEYFAKGGNDCFRLATDRYHLNPQGNALIAQATLRWLKEQVPATKPRPKP